MHRNTAILVGILALTAALLVGIQLGKLTGFIPNPSPFPSPVVLTTPTPLPKLTSFRHQTCGLSFDYPDDYKLQQASDSATLTPPNAVDPTTQRIILLCGVDFPKPPLPAERIEEATIAGRQATIYHDASAKDGTPLDVVIFSHPKNGLEVALFGFGEIFKKVIQSLKFDR